MIYLRRCCTMCSLVRLCNVAGGYVLVNSRYQLADYILTINVLLCRDLIVTVFKTKQYWCHMWIPLSLLGDASSSVINVIMICIANVSNHSYAFWDYIISGRVNGLATRHQTSVSRTCSCDKYMHNGKPCVIYSEYILMIHRHTKARSHNCNLQMGNAPGISITLSECRVSTWTSFSNIWQLSYIWYPILMP